MIMKYRIGEIIETENFGIVTVVAVYQVIMFVPDDARFEVPIYALRNNNGEVFLEFETDITIRGL